MKSKRKSKKSALGFSMGKFIFGLGLLTVGIAGYGLYSGYRFFRNEFPDVSILKSRYPVVHYQGEDEPPTISFQKGRPGSWTSLNEISRVAVGAIIVSEDWAFYQHSGYDPKQIKEAVRESWEAGELVRGASTITQQVAKNVFLDRDRSLWRKLRELYVAIELEHKVGKKRILETYLNVAEWGEGIFGIRAAANRYFHKSPAQLTAKEGAFLAMLLPSPKRYAQSFRRKHMTEYASRTVDDILAKMAQAHYINVDEKKSQVSSALSFEAPPPAAQPSASPEPEAPAAPDGGPGTAL